MISLLPNRVQLPTRLQLPERKFYAFRNVLLDYNLNYRFINIHAYRHDRFPISLMYYKPQAA